MNDCQVCGDELQDSPEHITQWRFATVDGVSVPVCLNCNDLVEEWEWEQTAV